MNKDSIREYLRATHTEAELQTWFDPLRLCLGDAGSVAVGFPHTFFARWFTKERQKNFERGITGALGYTPRFVYEKSFTDSRRQTTAKAAVGITPLPQKKSDSFSFDSFIYNKKNEFPVSVAREIAAAADSAPYTPFIICGRGGCGKTHLLQAMAGAVSTLLPPPTVHACTVEDLAALYAAAHKPGDIARRIIRYRAVFIDNTQDIIRYPELQHELVRIVDVFREKKRPLVLAIDYGPVDLAQLDPKFASRLEGGLSVTLKKPDLDIRLRYAKTQCSANRLTLTKELLLPIAQRFQSLRAIQASIAKIAAYQKGSGTPISQAEIEKFMANEPLSAMPVTPATIIARVAEAFGIPPTELQGSGRTAKIVRARQIAMFLCRDLLGVSLTSLGAYFGGKNHATVIHACKKIEAVMERDKDTHKLVTQIRKKFVSPSG